ncbi:hypothetical protein CFP56_017019 [Quercus suber]|uniref:Uncharacterized protein n=1 Tax=Quercus suber TaxID=58331 RepID=A0AAW0KLW6_QUESU
MLRESPSCLRIFSSLGGSGVSVLRVKDFV